MIEIPRSCLYYLEACREAELKEDHPTALRMLGLALHYADNSDDEFECMAEKLRIFDLLGADVPAVCYESIARRADGDDMYMALFNNAVVHKNAEQAAYYLDILESDDDVPLITAVEHGKAKEDEGLTRVNKLIAGLEREYRMSDIGFADAEEEYVGKVLEKAVSLLIASHGKEMSGVEEALQLRTDSPKLNEKINEVMAQCAEIAADRADTRGIYERLLPRAASQLTVMCAGCMSQAVREDERLLSAYEEALCAAVEGKQLTARQKCIAGFTFLERGRAQKALDILEGCDVSLADIFACRVYIAALFALGEEEKRALDMLEDTLLLEEYEDRLVWEFYHHAGREACLKFGDNIYSSVPRAAMEEAESLTGAELKALVSSPYGRYLAESVAHMSPPGFLQRDVYRHIFCIYTDFHPRAALKLLYDHEVDLTVKRAVLHRFLYCNDVYEVKKAVFMTSPDRNITVEDEGYVYRNDVIFDEEFDEWPDRVRAAACSAAVDCCFYNNYREGEIFAAIKQVYEKTRHMRGVVTFNTVYRAVVLTLNPDIRDFLCITGMERSEMRKIEAVAKKFGIEIK